MKKLKKFEYSTIYFLETNLQDNLKTVSENNMKIVCILQSGDFLKMILKKRIL
jgi:hypothetical protein